MFIDWGKVVAELIGLSVWKGATQQEAEDVVQEAMLNLLRRRMNAERPYAYMKQAVIHGTWGTYGKRHEGLPLKEAISTVASDNTEALDRIMDYRQCLQVLSKEELGWLLWYTETRGHSRQERNLATKLRARIKEGPRKAGKKCQASPCENNVTSRRADALYCSERCARRIMKRRRDARKKELVK